MKFEIVEHKGKKYLVRISRYTYKAYKVHLYRLYRFLPIKVFSELHLNKLGGQSISELIKWTFWKYEDSILKK